MATTSFTIDTKLDATLETLKEHFGASSKAEVVRKAIAMLSIVSKNEDEDGVVTIRKNGQDIKVVLK